MIEKRFLLVGFSLAVVIGAGIYFGRDVLFGASPDHKNFLGELLAVADNALGGKKSADGASSTISANGAAPSEKICSFETAEAPLRNSAIINEIAWMGSAEKASDEWIELKNIASGTASAGGWRLLNRNEKIKIVFGGAKIPAGGLYLAGTEKNIASGTETDLVYRGALRNTGDSLRLFDGNCHLLDEVLADSAWPAGDNNSKKTMERDSKTLAWHTSALPGGTPKKENTRLIAAETRDKTNAPTASVVTQQPIISQQSTATSATANQKSQTIPAAVNQPASASASAAPAAPAQPALCSQNNPASFLSVLINEVAWAGVSSDKTSHEWIELKNNYGSQISLAGWQLQNNGQSVKVLFGAADFIPAGGFYLLERGGGDFLSGVKADKLFTNAIKNSDEFLRLFDENCNVVDEVIANAGAEKNWPAGAADPDYRTAERSHDLTWHTYSGSGFDGIFGTPRAENSLPPAMAASSQNQNESQSPPPPPPTPTSTPSDASSTTPAPPPVPAPSPAPLPARSNVNHILISQIQTTGGAGQTTNDFIEIYNPAGGQFNLKGYRLVKRAQTGATDTLIKSWTADAFIPAYGFYLWANSGYAAISAAPDATTTAEIADDNGVAIRFGANDTGTIIDSVAWGKAQNAFVEGSAFSASSSSTNPGANQSLLRNGWQDACVPASFNALVGNGCDTDVNASDFELSPSSEPRNSRSL